MKPREVRSGQDAGWGLILTQDGYSCARGPATDNRRHVLRPDRASRGRESGLVQRTADYLRWRRARRPQIAHAGVPVGLTELSAGPGHQQCVVQEHGRTRAAEPPRKLQLDPCRVEEVVPADHEVNPLIAVIHGHCQVVAPLAVAVAQDDVAVQPRGFLAVPHAATILEGFRAGLHPEAQRSPRPVRQAQAPAAAIVDAGARGTRGCLCPVLA